MAQTGALVDLLLFYSLERSLFNRLACSMGKNPYEVKRTIALWLMLEESGHHDLIRTIHSHDDKTIEALFNEAMRCLECIKPDIAIEPAVLDHSPVFCSFLYYNREFMYRRFVHIMETVCGRIFGERAAIEVDETGMRPVPAVGPFREDSTPKYRSGQLGSTRKQTNLNPEASEFYAGQIPEAARTMFLTFSKGYPLNREEIVKFFTLKFGGVVEDVKMEHTRAGQFPEFGLIIFTTSTVIARVLNGHSKAKFLVNRKHLWARPYVQRHGGTTN